jgi:hypothetical protein
MLSMMERLLLVLVVAAFVWLVDVATQGHTRSAGRAAAVRADTRAPQKVVVRLGEARADVPATPPR